jgi:hypothetical protein
MSQESLSSPSGCLQPVSKRARTSVGANQDTYNEVEMDCAIKDHFLGMYN